MQALRTMGKVWAASVLVLALWLTNGCGGGAGINEPPKPLWETTRVVGPEGTTIETPQQYGAKVEVAPGTFDSATQLRVQVYPPEVAAGNLPQGVAPASYVVRMDFEDTPSGQQGNISISLTLQASRQSGDMWYLFSTIPQNKNTTPAVVLKGWHTSKVGQELRIDLSQEDIKKLLERLSQPPYLHSLTTGMYTYNSKPAQISPRGLVKYDPPSHKWRADNPVWSNKRIAILLHGMKNDIDNMLDLAKVLHGYRVYDEIWGFDYDWSRHIDENGEDLGIEVGIALKKADRPARIDLYGHSMGGLVARWALEKEGASPFVERLFTFGTPHLGVPIDDPTNLPGKWDWFLYNAIPWLRGLNTDGVKDLLEPGSSFLDKLNDHTPAAKNTVYIVFAGTKFEDYLGKCFSRSCYTVGMWASTHVYNTQLLLDGIVAVYSAAPLVSPNPVDNDWARQVMQNQGWGDITKLKGAYWVLGTQNFLLDQNHSEIKVPKKGAEDALVPSVIDNTNIVIR
ncbi:MAG: hypothetical protein K6U75_02970 [Firmicutes bacterium]|nr:hypothetical protein [Bacillota bacterium]